MPKGRRFVIVFVVDGLRPDAITHELTPTLFRLRSEGVDFTNSHSVFPTVTRVNAAAIGIGVLVNGAFDPDKLVGWPADVSAAILAKFGAAPTRGAFPRYDAVVTWTQQVLREYVLPDLAPDVVINWLTEPDHSQHHLGVGSASSLEALANDDREIARVLKTLDDRGLTSSTDVLVVSDHGFTTNVSGVDVAGALIE